MRKNLDATSLMSERHHWCRQDPPAQKKMHLRWRDFQCCCKTLCLGVFDHFVGLALKGLTEVSATPLKFVHGKLEFRVR